MKDILYTPIKGSNIKISILPLSGLNYIFNNIIIKESIGGELVSGEVTMDVSPFDKSGEIIKNLNYLVINIAIDKNSGTTYKSIYSIITSKSYYDNKISLRFLSCPEILSYHFWADFKKISYTGKLLDIVNKLWGTDNNINIKCDSDVYSKNNEFTLYQLNESNYTFLNRILLSYRKQSVFGYSLDGLFIKKVETGGKETSENSKNKSSKTIVLSNMGKYVPSSEINSSNLYHLHTISKTYQGKNDINTIFFTENSFIVHDNLTGLVENYIFNKNMLKSGFYSKLILKTFDTIPDFNLGDTIYYDPIINSEYGTNINHYFVVMSNTYNISSVEPNSDGKLLSVTSTLGGIEDINFPDLYSNSSNPLIQTNIIDIDRK